MDSKDYLIEILEFYIYKLKAGKCTLHEAESATKAIVSNMEADGTISDFAKFYNVPEVTVRTNINRKLFAKPKRLVLYPFLQFMKIVPSKWRSNK